MSEIINSLKKRSERFEKCDENDKEEVRKRKTSLFAIYDKIVRFYAENEEKDLTTREEVAVYELGRLLNISRKTKGRKNKEAKHETATFMTFITECY